MCFSAGASFGAAIVLSTIGIVSIKRTQTPKHIVFAAIPLIFAVQQLSEGILWKTLPNFESIATQKAMTYIFLTFAQVVWPLYVPFSIWLLEKDNKRKTILALLVGIGAIIATYLSYCLLNFHVEANIVGYHISYFQDYPLSLKSYGAVLYILATIAPLFVSSVKNMWVLGLTILVSYIVTALFYEHYVLSVWCFFSSLISIMVYVIAMQLDSPKKTLLEHSF